MENNRPRLFFCRRGRLLSILIKLMAGRDARPT